VQLGEFTWVVAGQIASAMGALVGVRLLSGSLHQTGYGDLALALTVATLGQQVLLGPLSVAGQRFFVLANEGGERIEFISAIRELFKRSVQILIGMNACLYVVLSLVWNDFLSPTTFGLAILFSITSGANSLLDGIQNAARRRKLVALHQAGLQWLRFLLAFVCVVFFGSSSGVALLGYVCASILILLSQLYFLRELLKQLYYQQVSVEKKSEQISKIKKYIWPLVAWGIFTWIQFSSDKWALGYFTTKSAVGTYAVLYQFGFYPLILITNMVQQSVSPILFARIGNGADPLRVKQGRSLLVKLNVFTALGVLLGTLVTFCFHDLLFLFLVSPEYRNASYLLPQMVLAGGFFSAGQVAALGIIMGTSTKQLLPVKIGSGVLGSILSFTFAYYGGLDGVVLAAIFSAALYYFWTLFAVSRKLWSDAHLAGRSDPVQLVA
jgi:O-antigen/teichoic acid export membrane protein